jgi:hypothetical protein
MALRPVTRVVVSKHDLSNDQDSSREPGLGAPGASVTNWVYVLSAGELALTACTTCTCMGEWTVAACMA